MSKSKVSEEKKEQKTGKAINEEAELLKAQLVRTLADYDNLVKRVERERVDLQKIVSLRIILKLLTILDSLEMAQVHLNDTGLAISVGEFKKILSEEGLTEIRPKIGDEFNEAEMEAIEVEKSEEDNKIISVSLVGWKYNDGVVVRHAKVKVSKKEI